MARWKEMTPWYPRYFVSNEGQVKGRRGRLLKLQTNDNGYIRVPVLKEDGELKMVFVARIVCWYFNGPFPNDGQKYLATHKDKDPGNNHYRNLEWKSVEEVAESQRKPPAPAPRYDYSLFNGARLRELRKEDGLSIQELAAQLPVSNSIVSEWENGHKKPRARRVERLAEIFDVEVGELLSSGG